jgi:hypothetical protein
MGFDVRTTREASSANVTSFVYTFEIPRVEVAMAQAAGVPIWSENVGNAVRKMNNTICNLITTGSNAWDKVDITGLYSGGTVCSTALDAVKWNTASNPITHAAAGFGDLYAAGFPGPYTWVMSSSLRPGLSTKFGAGDPAAIDLLEPYNINELIFLKGSGSSATATTRMNLYPMGTPVGDEGTWLMYPKDPNVAYLAEVIPITTTIKPELDFRRQCYHGRVEWRGTVAIVQATGISYEEAADLA